MITPDPSSIVSATVAHLAANAGVVAAAPGGVHLQRRPEGERRPCIVLERGGSSPDHTHGGPSGFVEVIMRVACLAETHAQAHAAATAVRLALDGFRGSMPGPVSVDGVYLEDEADGEDVEYGANVVEQVYLLQHIRA